MVTLSKESIALFKGIQKKAPAAKIQSLINKDTAKAKDPYYQLLPLFWALSYSAEADVISSLLTAYPEAARQTHPWDGYTPLHYADRVTLEVMNLLLKFCPEAASKRDKDGALPLHWAAEHNADVEVVKLLLEAYPDAITCKDKNGCIPYRLALHHYAGDPLISLLYQENPSLSMSVPELDDKQPMGILFPGMGSQYVGMMKDHQDLPAVKKMLAEARTILGYDIMEVCLNGPLEKLCEPMNCLPAMLIGGLAGVEKLKVINPETVRRACACAGLGIGEFSALVFAGVLSFEDALKIVRKEAELMTEALRSRPQKMLSVVGLTESVLIEICAKTMENLRDEDQDGDYVCQIAGSLFSKGFSIGGTAAAIEECQKRAKAAGAIQARSLEASGGWNTSISKKARMQMETTLASYDSERRISSPRRYNVYMSLNAMPIKSTTPPSLIAEQMASRVSHPVRWKEIVEQMIVDGIDYFYECGPGAQLKAMMKRIDADAWNGTKNSEV